MYLSRNADVNYFTSILQRFRGQRVETRGVLLKRGEQEVFSFIWAWVSERSDRKVVGQMYTELIIMHAPRCTMHLKHPYLRLPGLGHWFKGAKESNNCTVKKKICFNDILLQTSLTQCRQMSWGLVDNVKCFLTFQVHLNDCQIWRYPLNW